MGAMIGVLAELALKLGDGIAKRLKAARLRRRRRQHASAVARLKKQQRFVARFRDVANYDDQH